jgi:MFS family permease
MESLSNEAFLLTVALSLVASVLIGGIILLVLARVIGKIYEANYINSAFICLLSGLVYIAIYAMIWLFFDEIIGTKQFFRTLYDMGNMGAFLFLNVISGVTLTVAYVTIAKFIWKSTWQQTFLTTIVWVIVVLFLLAFPSFLLIRKSNKVLRDMMYSDFDKKPVKTLYIEQEQFFS